MMINRTLSAALMLMSGSAPAQSFTKPAHASAGISVATPQHLTLANLPRPTGKVTYLFDGRSLSGWTPWLGYADPSITYRAGSAVKPIGTRRNTTGDFAVRQIDGAPAIWVKGQIWGSLVYRADLSNYHLRLKYKWGERTWAPREKQPRNNGLLYHTHGAPGEVFGTWRPSVEFEVMQGSTGMIVMVGTKTRAHTDVLLDPSLIAPHLRFQVGGRTVDMVNGTATWNVEAATDAERPAGEWNTLDLYVLGDRALHVVNGVPVAEVRDMATIAADGTRQPLTHGQIQLQSEGAETWFREITVEPIRSLPRVLAQVE